MTDEYPAAAALTGIAGAFRFRGGARPAHTTFGRMDYIRQYRSFINSYYLSEGLRITVGLTLPAVILSYLGDLSTGITLSLGASCVIMVDNAGPIHHRRNAMMACDVLIFFVALATGFAAPHPGWLSVLILVFCFSFSMLGVYGSRASSLGLAGMFIMVLSIDRGHHGWEVARHATYVLLGGIWYTLLSLAIYGFRPYKLVQQAIGECMQETADYLRIRASFYSRDPDREAVYAQLLRQQASIHEKQDLIRELLFKSRDIIKESTAMGRMLILVFQDTVDLFEEILSVRQDDETVHRVFDDTDILGRTRNLVLALADELKEIGIAVKSGQPSLKSESLPGEIADARRLFEKHRDEYRTADNMEGFLVFRQMLDNLDHIATRLSVLHSYTTYENLIAKLPATPAEYDKFVSHQELDPRLLIDHLGLQSNIFRHALRVALATGAGYFVSTFFPFGHSFWILLTIIVILKPAYSITKKRNYDRLLGTMAGAAIGILLLHFIKSRDALFVCMVFCMIGAYSFMRTRYLVFVLLMTPYILLLYYLMNPVHFSTVIMDRVLDTGIGSGIAFLANFLILPAWEHEYILDYLVHAARDSRDYFQQVVEQISGRGATLTHYRLGRKRALVSMANLSDAFNRMLSEPRKKQWRIREIGQLVAMHQLLISHIAALSASLRKYPGTFDFAGLAELTRGILAKLRNAEALLQHEPAEEERPEFRESCRVLSQVLGALVARRKWELKAGIIQSETRKELSAFKPVADELQFIANISIDLEKESFQLSQVQPA